jgi:hypothetical protein
MNPPIRRIPAVAALCFLLGGCAYELGGTPPAASGSFAGTLTLDWSPAQTSVSAAFTSSAFAPAGCAGTQIGSCCAFSQPAIVSDAGNEPPAVNAGAISIADGSSQLGTLDFAGFGYAPLSSAETAALIWNPGDALAVSSAGATIGAFAAQIVAPPAFVDVDVALSWSAETVVHRGDDFTVTWTPPAAATETVTLELFDPAGFYVACAAPDAEGTVTAPAAALVTLGEGDDGYVTLSRPNTVVVELPDASINVTATASVQGNAVFE